MTRNRGALAGILIACLALLAVAGCGGDSDETETQTLSKAQYVKQADAICTKANNKQEALLQKEAEELTGVPNDADRTAFVLDSGLPPLKEAAAKLEELGAPAGEEKKAETLVVSLEKAIKQIEGEPVAFAEGESKAFVPVERAAKELGLKVCGLP